MSAKANVKSEASVNLSRTSHARSESTLKLRKAYILWDRFFLILPLRFFTFGGMSIGFCELVLWGFMSFMSFERHASHATFFLSPCILFSVEFLTSLIMLFLIRKINERKKSYSNELGIIQRPHNQPCVFICQ